MAKKTKSSSRSTKKTGRRTGRYRILSLDGGGIRGLITAVWLTELEKRLGGKIADHFDLVAGTSTGSILACGLSMGIPAEKLRDMYQKQGRDIFPAAASRLWSRTLRLFSDGVSAPKYDGIGLERALKTQFGNTRFVELGVNPTLVTSYNTLTRSAVVFKNTRKRFEDLRVWEVVKASCSAPTYFPASVVEIDGARCPLIDGGVVANNPSACAIAEGIAENREGGVPTDRFVVASFGTGSSTRSITIGEAQEWGALEWAIPVIDVIMDGALDAVDYISQSLVPPERYFRFQIPLSDAYDDLDNADRTNLNALVGLANQHVSSPSVSRALDELVTLVA